MLFRLEDVGGGAEAEQPTMIGSKPVGDDDGGRGRAAEGRGDVGQASGAIITAPPPSLQQRRSSPRLARTQGRPQAQRARKRRSERFIKPVSALIALAIVLFVIGGAAYLASREYFFIGTNSNGIVTVFRGFPYELPLGVHMYEQFYVSGVPLSAVPADRRNQLLNHQLRSQGNAISLVHAAEFGQLSQ